MKRLALLLLCAAPVMAAEPDETFYRGMALLQQARAQYAAALDDARIALRIAEAELALLHKERLALIEAIQRQAATIGRLQAELADCLSPPPPPPPPEVVPRLWIFAGTWRPGLEAEFADAGANITYILMQNRIGAGGHVDEALLRASLVKHIPEGEVYACLDMEKEYLSAVMDNPVGSAAYEAGVDEYIKAMTIAREVRPKAKWTWWAFPWQIKWTHDTMKAFHVLTPQEYEREAAYVMRHTRLNDLPDWFTPDGYDFWLHPPDTEEHRRIQQSSLKAKLDFTRRIAGDKPILVSTSHRRHVSAGFDLHPIDDWRIDQVDVSLQNGADGVVWWGQDAWYFSEGQIPDVIPSGMNHYQYFDKLARDRFECLLEWTADAAGGE